MSNLIERLTNAFATAAAELDVERYAAKRRADPNTMSLFDDEGNSAIKAKEWREEDHPRAAAGSEHTPGGRFIKKEEAPARQGSLFESADEEKPPKFEPKLIEKPDAAKPANDAASRVASLADSFEKRARTTEHGNGLAVGSGEIDARWKADALRGMLRDIQNGSSIEDAENKAKALSRKWIAAHNARRPKDMNWGRWEGAVDATIESASRMLRQESKQPEAKPKNPEDSQAESGDKLGLFLASALKAAANKPVESFASSGSKAKPESPGLIMPETTVDNSKAKSGDQLGLFGEATKAKVADKPFVPTLLGKGEQTKGWQGSMFETMGNPDQMNLFSDGSEPEGMVHKPKEERKSTYFKGDRGEFTGNKVDGFYELEMMEGHNKGKKLDTMEPPEEKLLTFRNADAIANLQEAASKLKRKGDRRLRQAGENIAWRLENYSRMKAADIHDEHELRAALREYLPLRKAQDKEDPIKKAERSLVGRKIEGFFPTPKSIVDQMLEYADIQKGHSILEPSAGKGDILDSINERHAGDEIATTALEIDGGLRDILKLKGHNVAGNNFMEHDQSYDRIVMNPPFEKGQDMEHVRHAYKLLSPGGKVVAIMAGGGGAKREEFDKWVHESGGEVIPLDAGSFNTDEAFRKTGVNTKMVVISKPAESTDKYSACIDMGDWVAKDLYSAINGAVEAARYSDNDDLRYDITPEDNRYALKYSIMKSLGVTVDRYEWNEQLHPRESAGSEKGGQFTSKPGGSSSGGAFPRQQGYGSQSAQAIKGIQSFFQSQAQKPAGRTGTPASAPVAPKPNLTPSVPGAKPMQPQKPARPQAAFGNSVPVGHHLHSSNLPKDLESSFRTLSNNLADTLGFDWRHARTDEDYAEAFSKVDKKRLQGVLEQFNQLDRSARGRGIAFSDYVNANNGIHPQLAKRLSGGSRFFDRNKIANKMNNPPKGFKPKITAEQHKAQLDDERLRAISPDEWQKKRDGFNYRGLDNKMVEGPKGAYSRSQQQPEAPKPAQLQAPAQTPAQSQQQSQAPAQKPESHGNDWGGNRSLKRNFWAGHRQGSMEFESPLHQALYDIGSGRRKAMSGKSEQREQLISSVMQSTGMSRQEIVDKAHEAYEYGKEQLKGLGEGEHRKLAMTRPEVAPEPKHEIANISAIADGKLNKAIGDLIGSDNPSMIADFRAIAEEAHRDLVLQAQRHNEALSMLAGGRTLGGNVSWARNTTGDYADKKNFDTAVDIAASQFPDLFPSGDKENDAMELLKKGKMEVPKIYDQEVMNRAIDMAGPQFFDYYDNYDSEAPEQDPSDMENIPFSWIAAKVRIDRYRHQAWVERYANERQMSFNWDESAHPRHERGAEDGKGGQFAPRDAVLGAKETSGKQQGFEWAEGHKPVSGAKASGPVKEIKAVKDAADEGNLKIRGVSKEVARCDRCGRSHLGKTIKIEVCGDDGKPTGDFYHFGSDCVGTVMGMAPDLVMRKAIEADYKRAMEEYRSERKPKEEASEPETSEVDRGYRSVVSGAQSSPGDISSYKLSNRPIGISVQPRPISQRVVNLLVNHAKNGNDVFLDSGIASTVSKGKGVDFEKVFAKYRDILDQVPQEYRHRFMVVAPDHLEKLPDGSFRGDQSKTFDLQSEWSSDIKELQDMGASVIVPIQRGEEDLPSAASIATDAIDFSNGNTIFGIPYTKGAWDDESILRFAKLVKGGQAKLHILGGGKDKVKALTEKLHEIDPDIILTGDAASELRNRSRKSSDLKPKLDKYRNDTIADRYKYSCASTKEFVDGLNRLRLLAV